MQSMQANDKKMCIVAYKIPGEIAHAQLWEKIKFCKIVKPSKLKDLHP